MFTVSVEALVVLVALAKTASWPRRLGALAFANIASHPAVWFVFPELGLSYSVMVILAETWAVGSELVFYRLVFEQLSWRRAVLISLLANALSLGLGLVVRALATHYGFWLV